MNASAAIANVRARGTEPEARGDQRECLPSRLLPLAWFLCDIATNRHGPCKLLNRLPFARALGKMGAV